jgi:negative regulator of genetic competence, sporulation and motility
MIRRTLKISAAMYDLVEVCAKECLILCNEDPSLDFHKAMERLEEEHRFSDLGDLIIQQAGVYQKVFEARLGKEPLHP